jgi:hypothetical protein
MKLIHELKSEVKKLKDKLHDFKPFTRGCFKNAIDAALTPQAIETSIIGNSIIKRRERRDIMDSGKNTHVL